MFRLIWQIRTLLALFAVAVLAAATWYGFMGPADAGSTPTSINYVPVRTVFIEMEDSYQVTRRYAGEIEPLRTSDLGFEREGYLKTVLVREGSRVEKDQPIASLDTRRLEQQLRELSAGQREAKAVLDELIAGPRAQELRAAVEEVNGLEAQLKYARSTRERKENLLKKDVGTIDEVELSRARENQLAAEFAAAQERLDELNEGSRKEKIQAQLARVEQLEAQLNLLQIDLDDSVLKAPYAGRVAQRFLHEGTVIHMGDPVVRLLEEDALTARVGLPLDSAAALITESTIEVQAGGGAYHGTVASRLPKLNDTTRTTTVIIDLGEDAARELVSGEVVHLGVTQTVEETGCWLPTAALVRGTRGLWACLAVSETKEEQTQSGEPATIGLLQKHDVEVLHAGESNVFVRGTLRQGDRVVADGTHRVVQGQWVELLAGDGPERRAE